MKVKQGSSQNYSDATAAEYMERISSLVHYNHYLLLEKLITLFS